MQRIAAWLIARPFHGVLGLAFSLLLPMAPILSGLIMTYLVFANGVRVSGLQAIVSAAVLAILAVVLSASVDQIVASAVTWWVPVWLLAVLARSSQSLTLTLQVSVIVAVGLVLAFFIVLGDPTDFWTREIATSIQLAREAGLQKQADVLSSGQSVIVPQLTMLVVFFSWSFFVMIFLLGYAFFQTLPEKKGVFGRFCDLNFGRVLAFAMALTSVAALVSGAAWLQSVSFVIFAVFWLQGLAILHWLHAEKRMPWPVLLVAYGLLPFLNVLLVMAFAVLGYTDAWFNFRARGQSLPPPKVG